VLAKVLWGICPAHWFGVAAGVPNEGSRAPGWKVAGILGSVHCLDASNGFVESNHWASHHLCG